MTVADERTLLPPEDSGSQEELTRLADLVRQSDEDPVIVGPDGQRVRLPHDVYQALTDVVNALQAGRAITIAPSARRLTTQEAADLLGISRPTLINLLDDGKIAYEQPGRHRRIRIEDVIAYRNQRRVQRREALDELIQQTEDLGLYDDQDS